MDLGKHQVDAIKQITYINLYPFTIQAIFVQYYSVTDTAPSLGDTVMKKTMYWFSRVYMAFKNKKTKKSPKPKTSQSNQDEKKGILSFN